jgi:hypothetical protein
MGKDVDVGEELGKGAAVFMVLVGMAIAACLIAIGMEIAKIYQAHAFKPTKTARILWIAGASLLAIWMVAGLLISYVPSLAVISAYVASWSLLIFIIVIEGCDIHERNKEAKQLEAAENLDNYLGSFEPSEAPGGNGHRVVENKDLVGSAVR